MIIDKKTHFKVKTVRRGFMIFLFSVVVMTLYNCKEKEVDTVFRSDFTSSYQRTWIGPQYWSNPIQDWQIFNGKLECLVSKKNRNVHVLTQKIDSIHGNLEMSVTFKLFNFNTDGNKNWIGFGLGSKGEFNDYRDDAIFGKGLNIGITTDGKLFIGTIPENGEENKMLKEQLKKELTLNVEVKYKDESYTIILSVLDIESTTPVHQIIKKNIDPKSLIGDLVLISNYENQTNPEHKSVAFKDWRISGSKLKTYKENTFGPIMFSQYTLSQGTLKLTAQMAPVSLSNKEKVHLQIKEGSNWKTIKSCKIDQDSRTSVFKIKKWDNSKDISYRLAYKIDNGKNKKEEFYREGVIRKEPLDKDEFIIAAFTGNDHLGFPHTEITDNVKKQDPDILFFSGDQIYEPSGGYGIQRSPLDKASLDYLRKWYMYGWSYRDLMKDRPTISITDDHDVYHGNIWGNNGKPTPREYGFGAKAQDAGGYKMPPRWVNMVQRTQTSHLPDPYDPTPVEQGIKTYYTDMFYGGISFAILEDRKFKSAPKELLGKADIWNGWVQNNSFDVKTEADVAEAKLLGDRQILFLKNWTSDWRYNTQMKVLLSQTIFSNVATLPEEALSDVVVPKLRIMKKGDYPPNDKPVSDFDSNGWPQTGRNKAIETIRKGFVFHLAGDQHLGSTIQYGTKQWNDGGYAFCVPSITNHWPRRWYPSKGMEKENSQKPKYTGDFEDGFGNKMTVYAVSNPLYTGKTPAKIYDRASGYGIVRLHKKEREITMECWPRGADILKGDSQQYEGWPIKIKQEDNYGKKTNTYLPEIQVKGITNPVIQITNEVTNEIVYTLRINGSTFLPKVFNKNHTYTLKIGKNIGDPLETKVFEKLKPNQKETLIVEFDE
ncbi:alkaline phosphatase D family protein [Aquimarina sediminis]|uniref:alkaline phosphatase D family protein n=1 Tax=Aquimarina sediminis TaxID=2070536 RepID=UPI0013E8DAEF|nr:alkaline phosphatase D family protein [Aquimarina sediminis]